jgi:hypothetical protein
MLPKSPRIVTGGVSRFRAGDVAERPGKPPRVDYVPYDDERVAHVPDLIVDDGPLRGVLGFYPNRERPDTAEEVADRMSPEEQATIEHIAKVITRKRRAMNKPKPGDRK